MSETRTPRQIPLFEELAVHKAAVKITNAGDGLSDALGIDPQALSLGSEVCYVLRGEVTQVNHRRDDDGIITRVHTVKTVAITEVERGLADELLNADAARIQRVRDEISGQQSLEDAALPGSGEPIQQDTGEALEPDLETAGVGPEDDS